MYSLLFGGNHWKTGGAWVACTTAWLWKEHLYCLNSPGWEDLTLISYGWSAACLGMSACTACIPSWLGISTACLGKSACTTCPGRNNNNCLGISATCLGLSACIPPWLGTSGACLEKSACTASWLGSPNTMCLGRPNSNWLGRGATCLEMSACTACVHSWLGVELFAWGKSACTACTIPGWGELTAWGGVLRAWDWVPVLPAFLPGGGGCLGGVLDQVIFPYFLTYLYFLT